AALESIAPLTNSEWNTLIENPPGLSLSEDERTVWVNAVSPDWFPTYGIPLLAGRDFTLHDDRNAPKVIVVNETFAKKYFGGANPVGRSIRNDPDRGAHPAAASHPHGPRPGGDPAAAPDHRPGARLGLRLAARQDPADDVPAGAAAEETPPAHRDRRPRGVGLSGAALARHRGGDWARRRRRDRRVPAAATERARFH